MTQKPHKPFSLVLGGGALRGIAHVGVLCALEEKGWTPSEVVGTSVGAVIGSLWAAGVSTANLKDWAGGLRQRDIFALSKAALLKRGWNTPGLYDPTPLANLIARGVGRTMTFAELPRDLTVVATDLIHGKGAVFSKIYNSEANVADIVLASSSIAGLFPSRPWGKMLLSDGMAVAPLPVEYASPVRAVAAVSLIGRVDKKEWEGGGAVEMALRAHQIMARQLTSSELACRPDAIVVEPNVAKLPMLKLGQVSDLIEAGYEAGLMAVDLLGG